MALCNCSNAFALGLRLDSVFGWLVVMHVYALFSVRSSFVMTIRRVQCWFCYLEASALCRDICKPESIYCSQFSRHRLFDPTWIRWISRRCTFFAARVHEQLPACCSFVSDVLWRCVVVLPFICRFLAKRFVCSSTYKQWTAGRGLKFCWAGASILRGGGRSTIKFELEGE